jgi:iron complex outermembrane receptor protein
VAERGELTDLTLEELLMVDVSAPAKLAQPMREAASVGSVITRNQIENFGWLSLNDLLFRQPGFAPSRDFERLTVAGRGLFESWNNNHLLMLVDGVPFNNASNGWAFTWSLIPTLLMDRVEVIRGPGSALYGTNATNGVVAVNTRRPSNGQPLEAQVRLGNAGTQLYDFLAGHTWSWLSAVAAYGYHLTSGSNHDSYDGSGRTDQAGVAQKFRIGEGGASHYLFLKLEGQGSLRGWSLQTHLHRWSFDTGHGWLFVVPDEKDRAVQTRALVWLRYRPAPMLADKLQLEYVLQWQRHQVSYRIKYLPDGFTFAKVLYPGGVVEVANNAPHDVFARAQAQVHLWREMTVLLGLENTVFIGPGDVEHSSNVDINRGGTLLPVPDNQLQPAGPIYEPIVHRPVENLGLFLQYTSGRILRQLLSTTLGVRYDLQLFEYRDLDAADHPDRRRSFHQLSPRVGVVLFPHRDLALKAMVERAFRAPAPTELFVSNSLLGNSSTSQLQPEQITTVTAAADWSALRHLTLRANWFYERFANQIAFSATKNFSANLYTRSLTGVEAELLFDAPLGEKTSIGGFANYTLAHLLAEAVTEPTITRSDRLTWAPEQVANAGASLTTHGLSASAQGHYQGVVHRRTSDSFQTDGTPTYFSTFRPSSVAPWFTLDARISYRFADWLRVGVQGSNLLDTRGFLVKNNDYPFDYQIDGIRVLGTLDLTARVAR